MATDRSRTSHSLIARGGRGLLAGSLLAKENLLRLVLLAKTRCTRWWFETPRSTLLHQDGYTEVRGLTNVRPLATK